MPQPRPGTWHDQRVPFSHTSPPSTGRSVRRAVLSPLALLLTLVLGLTGCGVRLDLPPAPAPVPEGQDAVRQEAAQAVTAIAGAARAAAQDAPEEVSAILQMVADDAEAHLDALGGVWEPPPRPEPADESADRPDGDPGNADESSQSPAGADPVADADAAGALAALETDAADLRGSAAGVDPELATLLVSISVNQHLHARDLRTALDLEPADAPEAPDDPFPAEFGPEAATLCRALDASGYVAEVRAGRTSGEESSRLAQRAGDLRAQAELIATRGGFSGTAEDPREPAYALDLEDLSGQAGGLDRTLVPAWLDLLGPAESADRDLISTQVLLAALAVHGQGVPVPTFPGRAD